jgi:folylpolyglutamate synthase/dihydropteroate synthase
MSYFWYSDDLPHHESISVDQVLCLDCAHNTEGNATMASHFQKLIFPNVDLVYLLSFSVAVVL